jgi:hypothetical protein
MHLFRVRSTFLKALLLNALGTYWKVGSNKNYFFASFFSLQVKKRYLDDLMLNCHTSSF